MEEALGISTENHWGDIYLERRRFKRIKIGFRATISSRDVIFEGVIEDLSETGVNVLTYSPRSPAEYPYPVTDVTLNFQPTSGEILNLHCNVKWVDKLRPHGLQYRIGMEIIDPPWEKSISFL